MINKKEFLAMRKELKENENKREDLIQGSRDIISQSKQIISATHRNDLKKAENLIPKIKAKIKKLSEKKHDTGMGNVARQEYVEAVAFYHFTKKKNLITKKDLKIDTNSYLLGLCDLTGELMRLCVNSVVRKDYDTPYQIKDLITEIYDEFLVLNLRNGELRKKFDQIKWNLRKVEDVVYDLQLRKDN